MQGKTSKITKLAKVITLSELKASLESKKEMIIRGFDNNQNPLMLRVIVSEVKEYKDYICFKGQALATERMVSECSGMVLKGTRLGAEIIVTEKLQIKKRS